ncbi:MAG: hypothetical protein J6A63_01020 [Clostridia bacterium]|nr:hypothetical protein [Clostridiales bacterium]MBO5066836.1 hypothetical protein [Clostridia bacterium]MBQ2885575.1 hypothetical protein [Alphaproteobacteria bacterium]MBR2430626.1 hypothetical protein [bacterium]MBR2506694.1 hypothetical protein [Bacilli bacterium]
MQAEKQKGAWIKIVYWSLVFAFMAILVCMQTTFAATETMWDRFETVMNDFYYKLLGISTIIAVAMAAVALVVRMVSRNQKAVDEASAWLKRILITWVILNSLGLIVAYVQPLIAGGNYVG